MAFYLDYVISLCKFCQIYTLNSTVHLLTVGILKIIIVLLQHALLYRKGPFKYRQFELICIEFVLWCTVEQRLNLLTKQILLYYSSHKFFVFLPTHKYANFNIIQHINFLCKATLKITKSKSSSLWKLGPKLIFETQSIRKDKQ